MAQKVLPGQSVREVLNYSRMWWGTALIVQWRRLHPGKTLHPDQLKMICMDMAKAAEIIPGAGREQFSYEEMWEQLVELGAKPVRKGRVLKMDDVVCSVMPPRRGDTWVLSRVLICAVHEA